MQTAVVMVEFNHPGNFWKGKHKQSRRSLEYPDNSVLTWMIREPIREDALFDLILTNHKKMAKNVKAGAIMAAVTMR